MSQPVEWQGVESKPPLPKEGRLMVTFEGDYIWVWDSQGYLCPILTPFTLWELITLEAKAPGLARQALRGKYSRDGAYKVTKTLADEEADTSAIRRADLETAPVMKKWTETGLQERKPVVKRYTQRGKRVITLDDLDIEI